ncbi:type II toxin-antitoxin system RelE family toxin [Halobacterium salinarum]|uniref:type II toxin-antitoxin system RelE family toxin n=1 Tax=Halobacterium salinarum TaxID=2242 RepID=UPI002552577D|nr:hypothetical protein [Halobacterium salinarum]MDL0123427.1 hypothetical protein [Halobacterium salinarum]
MAYDISFQHDSEAAFETLDSEATSHVQKKLERVANSEWRSPTDWNYSPWSGQSNGKYDWGAYRVFADVDEDENQIVVHEVRHRENLYR